MSFREGWHQQLGWDCTSKCLGAAECFHMFVCVCAYYQWLEQQLSSAPSHQHQAPSLDRQDRVGSDTDTRSRAGHLGRRTHMKALLYSKHSSVHTHTHTSRQVCKEKHIHTNKNRYHQKRHSKPTYRHTNSGTWIDTLKQRLKYTTTL